MRRRSPQVVVIAGLVVALATFALLRAERGMRRAGSRRAHPQASGEPTRAGEPVPPERDREHDRNEAAGGTAAPETTPQHAQSVPNGVSAEQALTEVEALVNRGKIGAARALAEHYLREIPDGPEASRIKALTGVHPHP